MTAVSYDFSHLFNPEACDTRSSSTRLSGQWTLNWGEQMWPQRHPRIQAGAATAGATLPGICCRTPASQLSVALPWGRWTAMPASVRIHTHFTYSWYSNSHYLIVTVPKKSPKTSIARSIVSFTTSRIACWPHAGALLARSREVMNPFWIGMALCYKVRISGVSWPCGPWGMNVSCQLAD